MKRREETEKGVSKLLICKVCGAEFLFTTGEQEFYHDRGLKEPRRCRVHRLKRKLTLPPEGVRNG